MGTEGVVAPAVCADDVAAWAQELSAVHQRIAPRFARSEMRCRAHAYLRGLLSPLERKNGWQLAEAAGEASPDGMQDFLNRSPWDADAVRDDLRAYVVAQLGDPDAVLVVDETGFLKKGRHSVGVKRQYSGTAGRVENCQVGVFLVYAAAAGRTYLDRALYLPKEWTDDPDRCRRAGVPTSQTFATKPQLAQAMVARAQTAGVPFSWLTGDCVYGSDPGLRRWLHAQRVPFVLAIKCDTYVAVAHATGVWRECVQTLAQQVPATAWQELSAGAGAKGPRPYAWAWLPLAEPVAAGWQEWLLVRRSLSDPTDLAYYRVAGPATMTVAEAVRVAGTRWAVEECLQTGKGEVGLDQYEVRKWDGWYRHVTFAMLAHAYLTVVRAQVVAAATAKGGANCASLRTHCCR
jgi:SRSO17 transposase